MLANVDPCTLAETDLFRGLTPDQLLWLSQRLHRKTFAAETNIIAAEQPGEVVYVILSGTVKIHVEQADGADVIISILGPGDTVGEMSVFDGALRSANVATLEETTMLWMDRSSFHESLHTIPQLTTNFVRIMSYRLRIANEQIQALATLNVYGRIARQTLAFADRYGKPGPNGDTLIPIRLTQGDIADLVGASRKRVNQVMVNYKRQHFISVDADNHMTVHDRAGLSRYCR